MTESAVKKRLVKLRTKLVAERDTEKAKNLNAPAEAARKHRERADAELAKIRADKAAKVDAEIESAMDEDNVQVIQLTRIVNLERTFDDHRAKTKKGGFINER
jgi:hypothetical protein